MSTASDTLSFYPDDYRHPAVVLPFRSNPDTTTP